MKNKKKYLWYLVGIGTLFLLSMMMLSSVLDIGDRLAKISVYLEYSFYVVISVMIFFLVINPIRIVVFSPSLCIATAMEKDSNKSKKIYKRVAKNILDNNELTEEEITKLENYTSPEELKDAIYYAYENSIKKSINKIIYNSAKTVMISTAISQNAKVDMYSVVACNLKMIKDIVVISGFRPSMKRLSKLSLNVLTTALIAEGLEDLNIDDILPSSTMNALGEIPLIKPVLSSVMQGTSNGLLTLRVGFVCRKYLFGDMGQTKSEIRAEAFKESIKMLPILIKDVTTYFPNKLVKLFSKKDKTSNEEQMA